MKDKRPMVMVCPVCGRHFVKRRNKSCPRCKTALYYPGEYAYDRLGYIYYHGRGWVNVEDVPGERIRKSEDEEGLNK